MAYRDCGHVGRLEARSRPRADSALTRNVLLTGTAFSSALIASIGFFTLGSGRDVGPASYASSQTSLKVALVDPTAPVVVKRDPRVALIPEAATTVIAKRVEPAPQPAKAEVAALTPLPPVRPAQQVLEVAAVPERIPMPRDRQAALQALAALDTKTEQTSEPDTTGSLGEATHALGYAATPEPLDQKPVIDIARPAAAKPAAPTTVATRSGDFIGPLLPSKSALATAKPSRPLTPHEKLWGSNVRVASLGSTDALPRTGFDPSSGLPVAPYDKQTAVYVITDRKVYMPDGKVLEAHSGLGEKMDDPRFVHVRMRGATPPHVYDLKMREALFHGVEAIRMLPIQGERAIHGRDGILAHTYMLGPSGQSNGCISFKDYDTFLEAFKDGKIARIAVLARLD